MLQTVFIPSLIEIELTDTGSNYTVFRLMANRENVTDKVTFIILVNKEHISKHIEQT